MAEKIKDYTVIKDFTSAGAGTSTWCIAEKDGKEYFIKQFLSPVLVSQESKDKLPAPMVDAMQKACVLFVAQKRNLYGVLNQIQTGALVVPFDMLVYNGHYLSVSEKITSELDGKCIYQLPVWNRLTLMRTLVFTMKTLADNRIVHSDIKLDNILIEKNEQGSYQLRLIDFDSSFFEYNTPTAANELHGDMVYFAPEAMVLQNSEGESDIKLDCRMDQFSVGLVLHEMWCGNLPGYPTEEYVNCAEALLCGETLQLSDDLPDPLRKAIEGMLKLDADERISYAEAYSLLGEELQKHPLPPKPPEPETPPEEPVQQESTPDNNRRIKMLIMIVSAMTILLCLFPLFGVTASSQPLTETGRNLCIVFMIAGLAGLISAYCIPDNNQEEK